MNGISLIHRSFTKTQSYPFSVSLFCPPTPTMDTRLEIRYWAALIDVEREYYYRYKTAYKFLTAIEKNGNINS